MHRRDLLSALLPGLAGVAWGQGGTSGRDAPGADRHTVPYAGGGIRGVAVQAPDGWLVTPAEARDFGGEAGFGEPPLPRTRSLVPRLELLEPRVVPGTRMRSPFALALRFGGPGQAPVDPAGFRVLYGAERVDVTVRLLRQAAVDADGLRADAVKLPPGRHRLLFQLRDSAQRVSEVELRVEIE